MLDHPRRDRRAVAKKLFGQVESPTPDMAIEELKETKETLGEDTVSGAGSASAGSTGPGLRARARPGVRRSRSGATSTCSRRARDSVVALRTRVNELTDWRSQIAEHREQLIKGAAVAGFVVGTVVAFRAFRREQTARQPARLARLRRARTARHARLGSAAPDRAIEWSKSRPGRAI